MYLLILSSCAMKRKEKINYAGVITSQAWIKETELSDSEVLTLPGGFEPATTKSLASTGHKAYIVKMYGQVYGLWSMVQLRGSKAP